MAIILKRPSMAELEIKPLPGTLKTGGNHSDKSSTLAPPLRLALAADGSCETALDDSTLTVQAAISLASPCGPGLFEIAGDASATGVLVDITIASQNGILTAGLSWKGSKVDVQ